MNATGREPRTRPTPWLSPDAWRTYVAGGLWGVGLVLTFFATREAEPAEWLRVDTDPRGLLFLAAALVGGWNFFPKGLSAARALKLDMNFLMTVAIVGAVLIGEPLDAHRDHAHGREYPNHVH